MKSLLLLFIPACLAFSLKAQINAEDSTVQTIAYWSKTDTITYMLSKVKTKTVGGVHDTTTNILYRITVTIQDSTATNYTMLWQYHTLHFFNNGITVPLNKATRLLTDRKLVIKTDENGTFQSLENWEDLVEQTKKAMALINLDAAKRRDARMQLALKKAIGSYSNQKAVETSLKELGAYFMFYGYVYELQQPVTDTIEAINYMMDTRSTKVVTTWLDAIDFEQETATFITKQTMDGAQMTELIRNMVESSDIHSKNAEAVVLDKFNETSLETISGVILDGPTGWVIRMEYYLEINDINDTVTTEEITLEIE